jgi:SAM-dependent methyltransferase
MRKAMRHLKVFAPATLAFALLATTFTMTVPAADDKKPVVPDVPYVPTPHAVVAKMLELAKITKDDIVYDLGCGDGRIVLAAAGKGAKKAIGFDIDPARIKDCKKNFDKATKEIQKKVEFRQKDLFKQDLSEATVVTMYLLPEVNNKLVPQLKKLKPGSRIVSHDFNIEGYKPEKHIKMMAKDDDGNEDSHEIFLWTAPLKAGK